MLSVKGQLRNLISNINFLIAISGNTLIYNFCSDLTFIYSSFFVCLAVYQLFNGKNLIFLAALLIYFTKKSTVVNFVLFHKKYIASNSFLILTKMYCW